MKKLTFLLIIFMLKLMLPISQASNGDRTQFFHHCRTNCERQNCTEDGIGIQEQAINYYRQSVFDKIFLWTCADECQYGCMWRTVSAFMERNWPVPQFFGKWPFIRFMGLQEPASVLFSILNFVMHVRGLRKLRREVRPDSPCFGLWHIFSLVNLNGWLWSSVFHARDFPITELLDYAFANSIILVMMYCFFMRIFFKKAMFLRGLISVIFLLYFINYFSFLAVGKFSYSLNMKINLIVGGVSFFGWMIWCYIERNRRPYRKKLMRFYTLCTLALTLEVLDFPPILWTFDAHALWHLATVPLVPLMYSFIVDDCIALRNEGFSKLQ